MYEEEYHPKFIIQDDMLRLGRVCLHKQLSREKYPKPIGGGWWYYDKDNKIFYLYGESHQYGRLTAEDFKGVYMRPSLKNTTVYFSTSDSLEKAMTDNVLIENND